MKRFTRIVITTVPVVTLLLITAATLTAHYSPNHYDVVYMLISQLFGYGLFWLPVYFYMAKAYGLCGYTRVALIGLTIYSVLNISYLALPMATVSYITMYEGAVMGVMSFLTLISIIKNSRKQWNKLRKL